MIDAASLAESLSRNTPPTRHLYWLPVQQAFLDDPSKRKLIRTGNQAFGKTTAMCEEIRRRAEEPERYGFRTPRRMLAISMSHPQSIAFQIKLWNALDRSLLHPRTDFDPVLGFRGRQPAVRWLNGTVLLFKSGAADADSFAGETVDDVFIDEPTTLRIYQEADRRVMNRGGYLIMGMTPINAKEPLDWLRELVAKGVVSEHHAKLEPHELIPVGHDKPRTTYDGIPMDEEWIAQQRSLILGHVASIVLDGEWETPPEGQVFPAFDIRVGGAHVTESVPEADVDLYIGIDHGERDHKQAAVLVGVEKGTGEHPVVWILDEYYGEGMTTHEDDAYGILAMLSRYNVSWRDLEAVHGDKPHDVRSLVKSISRKSNADLEGAIAKRLNVVQTNLHPRIRQAKKGSGGGSGSALYGLRWLHQQMLRPGHFKVNTRCARTIESLHRLEWVGEYSSNAKDNGWKDLVDSVRYALWPIIMRHRRRDGGGSVTIRVR